MAKVVKFKPKTPPAWVEKVSGADIAMSLVRMEMYAHDPYDLAEAVGVSYGCIMAIRSGRTMWPRQSTFFGLLSVLGLQMVLIKGGN